MLAASTPPQIFSAFWISGFLGFWVSGFLGFWFRGSYGRSPDLVDGVGAFLKVFN